VRIAALALAALALAGCADAPREEQAPLEYPLANPGFEEPVREGDCPPGWECSAHLDPRSFRFFVSAGAPGGGKSALCVEPVKSESWALVLQGRFDPRLGGRRLRFSLDAKLTDVTGRGAGAVVRAHDGHGKRLLEKESLATGTHEWRTLSVDFEVPSGAAEVDVGGLLEGRGRLCIDNARVEVLP